MLIQITSFATFMLYSSKSPTYIWLNIIIKHYKILSLEVIIVLVIALEISQLKMGKGCE